MMGNVNLSSGFDPDILYDAIADAGPANRVEEEEALGGIIKPVPPAKDEGAKHWQEAEKAAVETERIRGIPGRLIPNFFYHPRMMEYDFGPGHPLKPVRLERTVGLLQAIDPELECLDPGIADPQDILRVHSTAYLEAVERASTGSFCAEEWSLYGFSAGDTPPFIGIYEASLAYTAGSIAAAKAVVGGANRAFNIGGGLHHAMAGRAGGFCVFNDAAIAAHILNERFGRIMYVDIDLHHGDGVQSIFQSDPDVFTYSIHESGRTLYPGTGFETETGAGDTVMNVPLSAGTDGPTWRWAFEETFGRAIDWFRPAAIVLQAGCDAHRDDPLGHLECRVQDWLGAVKIVEECNLPTVMTGGGGYALANVPRMWAAAVLTLAGRDVPEQIPVEVPSDWGMSAMIDQDPEPVPSGRTEAERVVAYWSVRLS